MPGWIKMWRKIVDWQWYKDGNTMRLFQHLLLTANFHPSKWMGEDISEGQVVTTLDNISKELAMSIQCIRTSLTKLKSTNEITSRSTNKYTVITIVNWASYQCDDETSTNKTTTDPTNEQQTTNKQLTNEQHNTKKNKKEKKEKKEKNTNTYPQYCLDIIERWNGTVVIQPKVLGMNKSRLLAIDAIYKDSQSTSLFEDVFAKVAKSEFLGGKNDNGWICTFDWVLKQENWQKIVEGNYENRIAKTQSISASEKIRQILNQKESEAL